ncbi:MAG: dTDP-4-dehydrorhamnose 3,5-epimerase [Bacteroidetes bacterium]|nr:dTDP-4-dehydrorhamnose 3,5-epimerase [Bacteroidota bacterium]
MPFSETPIPGLLVFEPRVFEDDRGYFFESFNQKTFEEAGITNTFVQDNQARSTFGVLRGLHYQKGHSAQAKLVRVLEGEVFDVAVDLRPHSDTFGKWYGVRLSAKNKKQLLVPRGFGHGYVVLSPVAEFFYKCDNFYDKSAEAGIRFDDPDLKIDWQLDFSQFLLSEKDRALPFFKNHEAAL